MPQEKRQNPPAARRIVVAFAIALFASASSTLAIGTSNAMQTHGQVEAFTIPMARIGDRIWYASESVVLSGKDSPWMKDVPKGTIAEARAGGPRGPGAIWRLSEPMADDAGRTVQADRLDFGNSSMWFERGTNNLVAYRDYNATVESQDIGVFGAQHGTWRSQRTDYCSSLLYAGQMFAHSLMGKTIRTDLPVEWGAPPPACRSNWPDGGTYHFAGWETVAGVWASRWNNSRDDPHQAVWFAPGIPYPIRREQQFFMVDVKGYDVTELLAYSPGTTPRAAAGKAMPAPPFELKDRMPWGLDDSGIDHPFPLSKAFRMAKDAGDFPDLRQFLGKHPNAYALGAQYSEVLRDGLDEHLWTFGVTNGNEKLWVKANESIRQVPGLNSPLPAPLGGGPTYHFTKVGGLGGWMGRQTWYGDREKARLPSPDKISMSFPTVEALFDRWSLYAGPNATAPNTWGFTVSMCEADCPPGAAADFWIGTDRMDVRQQTIDPATGHVPKVADQGNWIRDALYLNATGHAVDMTVWESNQRAPTAEELPQSVPFRSSGVPAAAKPIALVATQAPWVLTTAQAAGIGLVGILVGTLYYAWPLLKSSAIGLFSRVRPDRVRDHPQRRLIIDVIEAEPGIHFSELRRRTGMPNGTLLHHLKQLVTAGAVAERPNGGFTCYFAGKPRREDVDGAAALKSDGARRILAAIRGSPGMSNLGLARTTGLAPSSVNAHVKRLQAAGLVKVERIGREVRLLPGQA